MGESNAAAPPRKLLFVLLQCPAYEILISGAAAAAAAHLPLQKKQQKNSSALLQTVSAISGIMTILFFFSLSPSGRATIPPLVWWLTYHLFVQQRLQTQTRHRICFARRPEAGRRQINVSGEGLGGWKSIFFLIYGDATPGRRGRLPGIWWRPQFSPDKFIPSGHTPLAFLEGAQGLLLALAGQAWTEVRLCGFGRF